MKKKGDKQKDSKKLWDVTLTNKAKKQLKKLEKEARDVFDIYEILERDLIINGPTAISWPNYTKENGHKKELIRDTVILKRVIQHGWPVGM